MKKIIICTLTALTVILSSCGAKTDSNEDIISGVGVHYVTNNVEKPTDESISANEAIMLISMGVSPEKKYDTKKESVVYSVKEITEIDGKPFYLIEFGKGNEDKFTTEAVFAVDASGNMIYRNAQNGLSNWEKVLDVNEMNKENAE